MEAVHVPALGITVKLGRKQGPPDPKNLKLAEYVELAALPAAPSSVHYEQKVTALGATFPMYLNDSLGDCTCAATGHHIEVWSANAQGSVKLLTDDDIRTAYDSTGDGTDDGRLLNEILNYWRKTGIGGDNIQAYAQVDNTSHVKVKQAVDLFGGLYIGVGLPITAQRQTYWHPAGSGANAKPYSWGGHCVNVCGYTATRVYFVTWGMLMSMTWPFWDKYVDEAYAVVNADWFSAQGKTPTGLDLQTLISDASGVK